MNESAERFMNGAVRDPILNKAIDDIKKSGIDFDLLKKHQIKIFNGAEKDLVSRLGFTKKGDHDLLSGAYKLVEFPFFNEKGEIGHYFMYKPIPSICDKDGKALKYLLPKGKPAIPYILPEVWELKDKTSKPLWITEGVKKALKLLQHNRFAVSVTGVWNFKAGKGIGKEGDSPPYLFDEIESFKWNGRTVYLGFDSDFRTNQNVRYALYELVFKLYSRNAIVKIATWKGAKGIDDYLVTQANPDQSVNKIEETAMSVIDFINPDHHKEIIRAIACTELDGVRLSQVCKKISKKLGISINELKREIEKAHRKRTNSSKPNPRKQYYIDDVGCLCKEKWTGNDVIKIKLANFDGKIKQEIIRDNGVEKTYSYIVEGKLKDIVLPEIEVPASSFSALNWLHQWGPKAIIEPGYASKDCVRHYIQLNSNPIRQTCYTHTGWRNIGGNWIYLSGSGAIGDENVSVELSREMERYTLPLEITNEAEAIKTSLSFLAVAEDYITYPIFALAYLSPLTTILDTSPNFIGYLYGHTGNYKSTLAVLALSHFGDFKNIQALPNFSDTANSIEKRGFILKDTLMVLDDYHPSSHKYESQGKESIAQRVIRAYGNRTGRGRLNPDATDKGHFDPRGMLLITGEEIVTLESTLSRTMVIEINNKADIHLDKLTELQNKSGLLPHAMASYIAWLRPRIERKQANFVKRFLELRMEFSSENIHQKLSEQVAFLIISLENVFECMVDKKMMTNDERHAKIKEGMTVFQNLINGHTNRIKSENPVRKFQDILTTLITQKKVKLADKDNGKELTETGFINQHNFIGGCDAELIGYYDSNWFYLLTDAVWRIINKFSTESGFHFPVSKNTLFKMLADKGLIEMDIKYRKHTVVCTLDNRSQRVLKIIRKGIYEKIDE